jgi:tRNA pseudouridine38-40 synthase
LLLDCEGCRETVEKTARGREFVEPGIKRRKTTVCRKIRLLDFSLVFRHSRGVDLIKIKLTIAYDGTNYAGWQVQKTGLGVQQVIEEAGCKLFGSLKRLHSSSRTDTGVHALGMVAHFELPGEELRMPMAKLPLAFNAHLPEDIRILRAARCSKEFHARFDAEGKQYRYFVWNFPAMNPLLRSQAWHVARPLDLSAMKRAATFFLGKHDFVSFAATRNYKLENTVRALRRCDIYKKGLMLSFVIEADGFLYKMCRGIVGTLAQVGLGKFKPEAIKPMLGGKDRKVAGMTAPAHGLVLWKVFY